MEDLLWNCISLQSKWNQLKRDQCYLEHYLSKNPREMEEHLKQLESYETEVLKTPLHESYRKNFLREIQNYKNLVKNYSINPNTSPFHSSTNHLNFLQQHSSEILTFAIFFCIGCLFTLVTNEYQRNAKLAQERGFREGFAKKFEEILKKHGASYEEV